jgi:putative membrane protein
MAKTQVGILATLAASSLILGPAAPVLAQRQYGSDGDWWWNMHPMMGYGFSWMGWIMMIVIWGLIVVGGVFLIRWLIQTTRDRGPASYKSGGRAMDILRERYAKGEISREEFESMKRDLT